MPPARLFHTCCVSTTFPGPDKVVDLAMGVLAMTQLIGVFMILPARQVRPAAPPLGMAASPQMPISGVRRD